jgi:hypothetical protein
MRTVLTAAVLLLATTSTGLVAEQNEFKTAGGFVDAYHQKNNDIYMRLYIRGIGDGISVYNAMQDESDGGRKLYCPPEKVGIVDAQYVAIMSSFLTKYPKTRSQSVEVVLLFALRDTFPCGKQ